MPDLFSRNFTGSQLFKVVDDKRINHSGITVTYEAFYCHCHGQCCSQLVASHLPIQCLWRQYYFLFFKISKIFMSNLLLLLPTSFFAGKRGHIVAACPTLSCLYFFLYEERWKTASYGSRQKMK